MSEPARAEPPRPQLEVRVGSSTNALQPIPGASRSLAAGTGQWLGLGLVALAAATGDQLTKAIVSSRLGLGDAVEIVGRSRSTTYGTRGSPSGSSPTRRRS